MHVAEQEKEVADCLEEYRRFWEQSLDRLDDYLRGLQAKKNPASRAKEKKHGRKK